MRVILKYISVLLLASAVSGCLRDNLEGCDTGNGSVLIQLTMPDLKGTRAAITDMAEHQYDLEKEDLYVLAFRDNGGDGSGDTFLYYTQPTEEVAHADNPSTRTYSLPLTISEGGARQRLVFLGNCPGQVQALLAGPGLLTKTKQELLSELKIDQASWGTLSPIPMWGETPKSVMVTNSTKGGSFGDVNMLFAVARIDVAVNAYDNYTKAAGLDNFNMQYLELRNVRTRGYVVPLSTAQFDGSAVRLPSVVPMGIGPGDNSITAGGGSVGPTSPAQPILSCAGQFFLHEADNRNSTNDRRVFMLMGGYYGAGNTTVMTYYRIDLYDRSNPAASAVDYLDILRGHRYMINITGADGPGYATPGEAISSVTTKLNAEVVAWNTRGIITDITGNYTLSVLPDAELTFDEPARGDSDTDNKVDVFTDYSGGWTVSAVTDVNGSTEIPLGDDGWLSVDKTAGDAYVTTRLSINVTEYSSTTPRYGRVYIRAGKWTYIVNVIQKAAEPDLFSVTPSSRLISFWSHRNGAMSHNTFAVESDESWAVAGVTYTGADWGLQAYKTADGTGFYVQCNSNSTAAIREAAVRITSGGRTIIVPIVQDWADCGIGGNTKSADFGGTTVQTHVYGGNPRALVLKVREMDYGKSFAEMDKSDKQSILMNFALYPGGDNYACWMVQNSSYGTYDTDLYDSDPAKAGGPYYSPANSVTACPAGWRLPNYEDVFGMAQLYAVSQLGDGAYIQDEIHAAQAFLAHGDAFQGHHAYGDWHGWESNGGFLSSWDSWISRQYFTDYLRQYPDVFTDGEIEMVAEDQFGTENGVYLWSSENGHPVAFATTYLSPGIPMGASFDIAGTDTPDLLVPVRCVKDIRYHYE